MTGSGSGPPVFVSDARSFGGAERYLGLHVRRAAERGATEAWVGPDAPALTCDELTAAGASVRVHAGLRRRPSPAMFGLARALRARRPRLVHLNATDQGDCAPALMAARRAGAPVVVTVHLFAEGRSRRRDRLSAWLLRRAAAVIAVSEGVAGRLRQLGVSSQVIENGVEAPTPDPEARAKLGVEGDDFLIGGIGRLTSQKGWDVLCHAAPLIRERVPDARIVVVGDGPERAALERAAGSAVTFAGELPGAGSLLHAFDLVIAPSRAEGFPLVPMEAMLSGVAVLGSDVPGLRDVIADEGFLVEPERPDALAAAVIRLAADRDALAAAGAQARERSGSRFAPERMLERTAEVYASVGA